MTGFKVIVAGYLASVCVGLVSQVPDITQIVNWLDYGALGLLGITVLGQLYIILSTMNRADKQRHDDHIQLNETLTRLREHCASSHK